MWMNNGAGNVKKIESYSCRIQNPQLGLQQGMGMYTPKNVIGGKVTYLEEWKLTTVEWTALKLN